MAACASILPCHTSQTLAVKSMTFHVVTFLLVQIYFDMVCSCSYSKMLKLSRSPLSKLALDLPRISVNHSDLAKWSCAGTVGGGDTLRPRREENEALAHPCALALVMEVYLSGAVW